MPYTKWDMKLMYDYCKEHNYDLPKDNQVYTNFKGKYVYVCPKHGDYIQSWNNHKNGISCPCCKNEKLKDVKKVYSPKDYYNWCIQNTHFIPIDDYINNQTKIRHKCTICGYVWKVKPNNIKCSQKNCPLCSNKLGINYSKFVNRCKLLNVDTPITKQRFYKSRDMISYKCNTCGLVYNGKVYDHIRNDNKRVCCPYCMRGVSKGEKLLMDIFKDNNILFESPKIFEDFKSNKGRSYHFDFYLPKYNVLIEYQGIQHYEPQEFFGGINAYNNRVYTDNLKKVYCKSKGIKLICIPYTYNTKDKIINFLNSNS